MLPRFHIPLPFCSGESLFLPPAPARHVQVLRLQPEDDLILFNGEGGQWLAKITEMGRKTVRVLVGSHEPVDLLELRRHITLAVCVPANDRMEFIVEKATELGVALIQPLQSERSVLRLSGERAVRKREHWQAVAVAACEQSGRTKPPVLAPVLPLLAWLSGLAAQQHGPHSHYVLLTTGLAARRAVAS
jgi:16S rRNA (uracil1498-N3)-methyltransferase